MIGVIPAAGKGTRAYPYTKRIPKAMLKINGKPLLHSTICIMRDKLAISEIYIIVSELGQVIKEYFGDGTSMNVRLYYIENKHVDRGLAYSILLAKEFVNDYFCVILSDEYYLNTNHDELLLTDYRNTDAVCAVKEKSRLKDIRKNYNVLIDDNKIIELTEKPKLLKSDILGCGTWIFNTSILEDLENEFKVNPSSEGNLVGIMNDLLNKGRKFQHFNLNGGYININSSDDLNMANNTVRSYLFDKSKISIVIPVSDHNSNIKNIVNEFWEENILHEIVLVSEQGKEIEEEIGDEAKNIITLSVPSNIKEYGERIKFGLDHASGDILIIAPNDESFSPKDLNKLLIYICEADLVIGTRTTRQMIEQGTNMSSLARIANYLLAKMLEMLWPDRKVRLTDMGCIFRAFWRSTYKEIRDSLKCSGPEMVAEMIIEVLARRMRIIEIPVNYCRTTDESHINLPDRTPMMFFKLSGLIFKKSFKKKP